MVEDVVVGARGRGGKGWRGRLLFTVVSLLGIASACGGRTVWVEEDTAGESGDGGSDDGGTGGYGGDGGGYGGTSYGGTSYGGTSYGGTSYGGTSYGGSSYGGSIAGTAGYPYGGVSGTAGYPPTGGVAGTSFGGVAGTGFGGVSGTGTGGCAAASGTGGGGGFPALGKACSVFCPRYPYKSCPSDFNGPQDCLAQCQDAFGLEPRCEESLYSFLVCASQVLQPNAMCTVSPDGLCYGPGCTLEAVNLCAEQYYALLECQQTPPDPCPPPPDRPPPPGCFREGTGAAGYCELATVCPNVNYSTACWYGFDGGDWYCDCIWNGQLVGSATSSNINPCQEALTYCGFP